MWGGAGRAGMGGQRDHRDRQRDRGRQKRHERAQGGREGGREGGRRREGERRRRRRIRGTRPYRRIVVSRRDRGMGALSKRRNTVDRPWMDDGRAAGRCAFKDEGTARLTANATAAVADKREMVAAQSDRTQWRRRMLDRVGHTGSKRLCAKSVSALSETTRRNTHPTFRGRNHRAPAL